MSYDAEKQQARRERLRNAGIVTLGPLYIDRTSHAILKREADLLGLPLLAYATEILKHHIIEMNRTVKNKCEHKWRQWDEFPGVDICRDCGTQRPR